MNESPKVCHSWEVKSRKAHTCNGCCEPIVVGQKYMKTKGIWDKPEEFKHCLDCWKIIDNFKLMDKCINDDDGPSLDRFGVGAWLQGFMCHSWRGHEAIADVARLFDIPLQLSTILLGYKELDRESVSDEH